MSKSKRTSTQTLAMPATDIARVLSARLATARLSRAELSRRTGIPWTTLSHYFAGRREPSLTAFRRVCRGLGVSPADVIRELSPIEPVEYEPARRVGRPRNPPEPAD